MLVSLRVEYDLPSRDHLALELSAPWIPVLISYRTSLSTSSSSSPDMLAVWASSYIALYNKVASALRVVIPEPPHQAGFLKELLRHSSLQHDVFIVGRVL